MKKIIGIVVCTVVVATVTVAQVHIPWEDVKCNSGIQVVKSGYGEPYPIAPTDGGWEDSPQVTPNGLYMYAYYAPADVMSLANDLGGCACYWTEYENGSRDNMAFRECTYLESAECHNILPIEPPPAQWDAGEWFHGDLLYANRSATNESFSQWKPVNNQIISVSFHEANPFPYIVPGACGAADICRFYWNTTEDAVNNPGYSSTSNDIYYIENVLYSTCGDPTCLTHTEIKKLPPPVNTPSSGEENVSVYPDPLQTGSDLVLFFDSNDRNKPSGEKDRDLWYAQYDAETSTWHPPVKILNTTADNSHAVLRIEDGELWIYYTNAPNKDTDLGIWRAKLIPPSTRNGITDYSNWTQPEAVILPNPDLHTVAVTEPSFADNGDLYCAVLMMHPDAGSGMVPTFDLDIWCVPKTNNWAGPWYCQRSMESQNNDYRPSFTHNHKMSIIDFGTENSEGYVVSLYTTTGQLIKQERTVGESVHTFNYAEVSSGIYLLNVIKQGEHVFTEKIVINR